VLPAGSARPPLTVRPCPPPPPPPCADAAAMAEVEEDMVQAAEEHGPLVDACVYATDPRGIVTLTFTNAGAAAAALAAFSGRFYSGRRLQAAYWDGVATFGAAGVAAAAAAPAPAAAGGGRGAESERLEAFGVWLEGGGTDAAEVGANRK
jgi:HIV Tat-specific factor 1